MLRTRNSSLVIMIALGALIVFPGCHTGVEVDGVERDATEVIVGMESEGAPGSDDAIIDGGDIGGAGGTMPGEPGTPGDPGTPGEPGTPGGTPPKWWGNLGEKESKVPGIVDSATPGIIGTTEPSEPEPGNKLPGMQKKPGTNVEAVVPAGPQFSVKPGAQQTGGVVGGEQQPESEFQQVPEQPGDQQQPQYPDMDGQESEDHGWWQDDQPDWDEVGEYLENMPDPDADAGYGPTAIDNGDAESGSAAYDSDMDGPAEEAKTDMEIDLDDCCGEGSEGGGSNAESGSAAYDSDMDGSAEEAKTDMEIDLDDLGGEGSEGGGGNAESEDSDMDGSAEEAKTDMEIDLDDFGGEGSEGGGGSDADDAADQLGDGSLDLDGTSGIKDPGGGDLSGVESAAAGQKEENALGGLLGDDDATKKGEEECKEEECKDKEDTAP